MPLVESLLELQQSRDSSSSPGYLSINWHILPPNCNYSGDFLNAARMTVLFPYELSALLLWISLVVRMKLIEVWILRSVTQVLVCKRGRRVTNFTPLFENIEIHRTLLIRFRYINYCCMVFYKANLVFGFAVSQTLATILLLDRPRLLNCNFRCNQLKYRWSLIVTPLPLFFLLTASSLAFSKLNWSFVLQFSKKPHYKGGRLGFFSNWIPYLAAQKFLRFGQEFSNPVITSF